MMQLEGVTVTFILTAVLIKCTQSAYSANMETEIRNETVLHYSYDPVSRPDSQTRVKVGLNILAIDELEFLTSEISYRLQVMVSVKLEFVKPICTSVNDTHLAANSERSVALYYQDDLKGQKLTMAGWLTFEWEDGRIVWNKTEKDDIDHIFTKPKHIWKPELVIDNALEDLGVVKNDDLLLRVTYTGHVEWEPPVLLATHCKDLDIIASDALLLRVKYDGTVDWEPPMLFVTHCEVDITYYPYDEQTCAVKLVSWTYTIEEVELDHLFEAVNLEDFEIHGEWILSYTKLEDKHLTELSPDGSVRTYPQVNFWMFLRRRTQFYNLNVMLPIILTSLMVAMVFIVPVGSGEKVSYVLTVFLSLAVLLTIVTDTLPPTSITLSVLGIYLGIVLIFSALASLLTILILILYHKEGHPKPSSFVVRFSLFAAYVICWEKPFFKPVEKHAKNIVSPITDTTTMDTLSISSSDFNDDVVEEKNKTNVASCSTDFKCTITWTDIAQVLDRLCFFSFTIVTILMNLVFVVTLAKSGQNSNNF